MTPLAHSVLRCLSDGAFHSGESLAQTFGCSRGTIWQAIEHISQHLPLTIYRVRGQGYRLPHPITWLEPSAIRAGLLGDWQLEVAETIDSTNSALLTRASHGAPHRTALFAEWQTAGRGRHGRKWLAQPGAALTFSLLWRFECGVAGLSGLSLVVGLALVRVLQRLEVPVALKWPNDVLLDGEKLAGILIELSGDALGPSAVVIGIGLNLIRPTGVDQAAAGLEDHHLPDRNQLAALLLNELDQVLGQFAKQGFAAFRAEWEASHAWQHQPVDIISAYRPPLPGIARGVDNEGALRLQLGDGQEKLIHAGEVSLRRTLAHS